jgi:hypothetical protein
VGAITVATNRERYEGDIVAVPMDTGAGTIPKGAGVCLDATGAGVNATDGHLYSSVGIAVETKTFAGSADGDTKINVDRKGVHRMAFSGTCAVTDIGKVVYWVDNNTVALIGTTTYDVPAGVMALPFISTSELWVDIGRHATVLGI